MITAQAVETSVTNNSLSEDYPHPDDHTRQAFHIPGLKPFSTAVTTTITAYATITTSTTTTTTAVQREQILI